MNKKVIMAGAAVIMSAVAVGFGVNINTNMTDFMSANLEALTQNESGDIRYKSVDDYRADLWGGIMCCNTDIEGYCSHGISCKEFE